jgi:hypothetical protein
VKLPEAYKSLTNYAEKCRWEFENINGNGKHNN